MTIVVGIVDAELERRGKFVARALTHLDTYQEMARQRWDQGDLTILAASAESTPIHQAGNAENWAWVMGDIYADEDKDPASHLLRCVEKSGPLDVHGHSGYYLACTVAASGLVTLGTDILGLFPLYYWSSGTVLVFSTLPSLIHLHPDYAKRISAEGLAGVLLQSYLANCQTLWEGIRRSEPGHALQWQAGSLARTRPANPLLPSEAHFGLEYGAARKLFDSTLHEAIIRSSHRSPGSLMLSGGMDSRLVAGHLHVLNPGATTAFIFGASKDNEVHCAQGVARALGMPSRRIPVRLERFPELALAEAREEHLANTFHDFAWLTGADSLKGRTRELINGLLGDAVMGGSLLPHAYDPQRREYNFDTLLANANLWGFSSQEIVSLVRAIPMDGVVESCIEKMRASYDSMPGQPFQKATLWHLYHRGRHHAGAYAWRLAKFVWPVMPYQDRPMLETCLGMPLDYLSRRRMQIDTLKHDYRHLAVLPRDRNAHDTRPLIESQLHKTKRHLHEWLRKLSQERRDPRTYYRVFDINNMGWRAIRQLASTRENTAYRLFDQVTLAKYLPPAEHDIACGDGITHSARLKTLVGLMLLSDLLVE